MPDKKSNISDLIYGLWRINQLVDLCIDRELYEYVDQILKPSADAQEGFNNFRDAKGEKPLEYIGLHELEFPIEKSEIPTTIIPQDIINALFRNEKEPPFDLTDDQNPLLKHWSNLFWAKRIRSELQQHNTGSWLDRFEDLNLFLESHMPPCVKQGSINEVDYKLTRFMFLMELSAVAQGEASFGYAERARILLNELYPPEREEPEREPYDRWVGWNMGMAYQHIGRNKKAVLEFNRVIKEYFGKNSAIEEKKNLIVKNGCNSLEFILNILPATLQRAAINLKQQLGYHALQTLVESGLFLNEVSQKYPNTIYSSSVSNLRLRIDLLRLDAFQQLSSYNEAEDLLKDIYEKIFKNKWDTKELSLPPVRQEPPSFAQTQLVEQIVKWFLEKTTGPDSCEKLIGELQESKKGPAGAKEKDKKIVIKRANYLSKAIEAVTDRYWKWVEDNPFDKRIYFSRWAQFLKHGISSSYKLHQFATKHKKIMMMPELEESAERLLEVAIKLYQAHYDKIPVIRSRRNKHPETLELERFRSDDLPDFVNGLFGFYKKMSDILLATEENAIDLREKAEEFIRKGPRKDDKPIDLLKRDHFQLLAALDEYHKEFGENQQIHALKRCNERLIWHADDDSGGACLKCFKSEGYSLSPESFDGLLTCQEKIPRDQEDLPPDKRDRFDLYCYDYESIMQAAEKSFKKHLKSHSCQKPRKKALHFMGLQRWNSLTPAQGRSVGGGYFIYRTNDKGEVDLGIAIDPGFDYVRNLFRMGFSLRDVDIVLISHAHADHLWDFESMVQLLHELKDKESITHQLNVILTLGSYQRLAHIINNPELRRFVNPLVIDIRKEIEPDFFRKLAPDPDSSETPSELFKHGFAFFDSNSPKNNSSKSDNGKRKHWLPVLPKITEHWENRKIEIWPTRAYHDDYSGRSDSFGFLIKFDGISSGCNKNKDFCFGYTGDTKWVCDDLYSKGCCPGYDENCEEKYSVDQPRWKDVASQYKKCDVLLMHLGSLIDHKGKKKKRFVDYPSAKYCEKLIRKKNHPYLMGMIRFLRELYEQQPENKKLILIGEFGEELRGGIRTDLVTRLRQSLKKKWRMLPVDVGLDILLHPKSQESSPREFEFLCALCDKHRPISEVDYFKFGPDEAIFYTCKTCKKSVPPDVRDTRLRQLYDIGRELRTLAD